MRNQREINQIKELIKNGFDLKLISFELDISIEELVQYKIEIETTKIDNAKSMVDSKIKEMRGRYRNLYFRKNKVEIQKPKELSEEDLELAEKVIETIEQKLEEIRKVARTKRKYIAADILPELAKIEGLQLPMKQAEKIYVLLNSQELDALNTSVIDKLDYYINRERMRSLKNYAKSIELEQYEVYDIEKLKTLERKITVGMASKDPIVAGTVKDKISNKILSMRKNEAINRIRNDIPESITKIIQGLVDGNIDIEEANKIIDEETKRRISDKPKTVFRITEEQERRQILIQIKQSISNNLDQYYIQNPETTIIKLQELTGESIEQSISTVVQSYIKQKDFETAKSICDKFGKDEEKNNEHGIYMRTIRNEIRNAEISDIVMNLINMEVSPEQEGQYYSLIEKGIKKGNVNLRAISLGKSKDGTRNITLADIWHDENQKCR